MLRLIISIFILTLVCSCTCIEPNEEYVREDFMKYYSDYTLVSLKNTENSPPCFYWEVKFKEKVTDGSEILSETWQYWKTKQKCYWKLRVIKSDTSYYIEMNVNENI